MGESRNIKRGNGKIVKKIFFTCLFVSTVILVFFTATFSQTKFEDKKIERIQITFEGKDKDLSASDQFHLLAKQEIGETYSTVRIRNALEKLYETKKIVSAKVEATERGSDQVLLRFIIKRKAVAKKVSVEVSKAVGQAVTEQSLSFPSNNV